VQTKQYQTENKLGSLSWYLWYWLAL